MCSLRTVITQAAIMENIYSHVERPVILVPGAGRQAPAPLFLIEIVPT
jgi:hypothetical protein